MTDPRHGELRRDISESAMLGTEVVIAKSAQHDDLIVSKLIVHDTQKSGGQSRERG
jgi:hypothetical protein